MSSYETVFTDRYINIKKVGTSYRYRVYIPCTPPLTRKQKNIPTQALARKLALEARTALEEERNKKSAGYIPTFKEAKEQYLKHNETKFKPSGLYGLITFLAAYTKDWDDRRIDEIKKVTVYELGAKMAKTLSVNTVNRNIRYIRSVFSYLVSIDLIQTNPTEGVSFGKSSSTKTLSAMNRTEIKILLESPIAKAHPLYPFIFVGYHTGARSGELKELKVKDIDLANRRLVIARSYCAKAKMAVTTKSGHARTLPLNDNLSEFLETLIAGKSQDDYVLPRYNTFIRGAATKQLKQLQQELGIKSTNFHSIRASFITHLFQAGVNLGQIQLMAGHIDLKTTQRYIRFTADDLKGTTTALEVKVGSIEVPVDEFTKALNSLA